MILYDSCPWCPNPKADLIQWPGLVLDDCHERLGLDSNQAEAQGLSLCKHIG